MSDRSSNQGFPLLGMTSSEQSPPSGRPPLWDETDVLVNRGFPVVKTSDIIADSGHETLDSFDLVSRPVIRGLESNPIMQAFWHLKAALKGAGLKPPVAVVLADNDEIRKMISHHFGTAVQFNGGNYSVFGVEIESRENGDS